LLIEMLPATQRYARACVPVLLLAFCVVDAAAVQARPPALLSLDGISGARPGVAARRLEVLWGVRLHIEASPAFPGCRTAIVHVAGITGAVMFSGERWTAAWFTNGVRTREGIHIGSTLADVRRAYGTALSREHSLYVRGAWIYYVRRQRAPHWRLRFDVTSSGAVEQIGFGATPDVLTQEGCA
jgi:hypothetical protein